MATQTLKYEDKGLNSVAVDQAGNLVTDNAGNLVIPIEPFYAECTATNYGCDPDYSRVNCDIMTVTLPDRTVSYNLCPDEFKNDEIAVLKNVSGRNIVRFNVRTLQSKYGDNFQLTVEISAEHKANYVTETVDGESRKCEYIYYNRGYVSMKWGDNSIASQTDACINPGGHSATFSIDLANLTIASDTESINLGDNIGLECDRFCHEIGDDDPYEVTAYCDVALCSDTEPSVYRSRSGGYGDWLFSSSKVTVTVHPDRGETPESELQKAAICSVISDDNRKYIVTSTVDPKRYYRDESKDIKGEGSTYRAKVTMIFGDELIEYECDAFFQGVNVVDCVGNEGGTQLHFSVVPDDPLAPFGGMSVWSDWLAGELTEESFWQELGSDYVLSYYEMYCDNGEQAWKPNDESFHSAIIFRNKGTPTAYAWTTSPCDTDRTIYTEKAYGGEDSGFGVGDAYATLLNGVLQWEGTIVASGNALYSVTGSDGITRYWKADIEVKEEEIDEEFE